MDSCIDVFHDGIIYYILKVFFLHPATLFLPCVSFHYTLFFQKEIKRTQPEKLRCFRLALFSVFSPVDPFRPGFFQSPGPQLPGRMA